LLNLEAAFERIAKGLAVVRKEIVLR